MNLHELFRKHDNDRKKTPPCKDCATVEDLHQTERRIEAGLLLIFLEILKIGRAKGGFNFKLGLPVNKTKDTHMIEVKLTNEQKVNVTVNPVTATGKPAKVDGAPVWIVSDGNATVKVADDGLSADLISSDDPGTSTIVVSADADLGEGVQTITDSISLVTVAANAASLGFTVGTPVAKA